jgi:hypothetical protein
MRARLMCIAAVLSMPLFAQSTYYLPQVIDGSAPGGSLRTTIILANSSATTANVTIALTRDDGSPRQVTFPDLGGGSQFSITLKPGAARILQTDGSGDGSAGAATISSSAALGVSTIVSAYDPTGVLLSESGAAGSSANSAYVIPVDSSGGLNTGIAVYNPGTKASTLTFTLFDSNGAKMASAAATLSAGGHLSRLAAGDLLPGVSDFQGTLALQASAPVAAATFRQNAAALSYTLLEAVPQTALGLNFYLPQVADGPSGTATIQTTFLLYNLSASPASVTLMLSQSSGAPWMVNIPGMGADSTFTLTVAAGGSAFLQTDGQGASTTGAASIKSSQPIGVAAVVTASDSDGNFLSETSMVQSPAQEKFLLTFDTTNNIDAGVALFNPSSLPVTVMVSQIDSAGNAVANAPLQTLAPGAQTTAYVSDLFPGVTGIQGGLTVTAAGSVGAAVSALALRQNSTPLAMASTPVAPLPLTGAGITIMSTLDSKSQAKATIPLAGGSLALTDAKGNKFTLTIPAHALLTTTTVTMTAVTSISGLPAGGSFNAGVQIEPDGLALLQPALLTITLASPPAAGTAIPLGWHGTGQGVYLNIVQPQSNTLTMALSHFSGAGVGTGSDAYLTSQLLNIGNVLDLDQSLIAYWTNMGHDKELLVGEGAGAGDFQRALQLYDENYIDIQHFMELALQTGDDDTLACATYHAIAYQRGRELVRGASESSNDAIGTAIDNFVNQALNTVEGHAIDQCQQTHDPLVGFNAVGQFLAITARGIEVPSFLNLLPKLQQCSPAPTLNFQSEMSGTGMIAAGGAGANGTWDSKVSAQITLTGTIAQDSFNGTGDGYTSYTLSGSGPLKYNSFTLNAMSWAPVVGVVCNAAPSSNSGSTLTVTAPKSQIQYQFTPKFNPRAVLSNRQPLTQFCPVFSTTPVSVTLAVDPGSPQDSLTVNCTMAPPVTLQLNYWKSTWSGFHMADGGVITGFQIPGSGSFAHKEIDQTVSSSVGPTNEKTTLDLNQQP